MAAHSQNLFFSFLQQDGVSGTHCAVASMDEAALPSSG